MKSRITPVFCLMGEHYLMQAQAEALAEKLVAIFDLDAEPFCARKPDDWTVKVNVDPELRALREIVHYFSHGFIIGWDDCTEAREAQ